jgi:hypothetical protein
MSFSSAVIYCYIITYIVIRSYYTSTQFPMCLVDVQWLRRYVTNRKVAGSRRDELNDFYLFT